MRLLLAEISPGQAPFDWLSVVVVPAIMTVTLGLYAGLLGSRMFAFFQVRTKAVSWVLGLKKEIFDRDYESPFELSIAFTDASHEMLTEVRGLGHEKLNRVLQDILKHHLAVWAQLIRVRVPTDGLPDFPGKASMLALFAARGFERFGFSLPVGSTEEQIAHFVWKDLFADCRDEYARRASTHVAQITGTGPNWLTLLNPLFFPDYLSAEGEIIGLLVAKAALVLRST